MRNNIKMPIISTIIQHCDGGIANTIREKKQFKRLKIGNKEIRLSLSVWV